MNSPLAQGTHAVYTTHLLSCCLTDEKHCLGSPGFVFRRIPLSCLKMAPKGTSRHAEGIPGRETWKHGFTGAAWQCCRTCCWRPAVDRAQHYLLCQASTKAHSGTYPTFLIWILHKYINFRKNWIHFFYLLSACPTVSCRQSLIVSLNDCIFSIIFTRRIK